MVLVELVVEEGLLVLVAAVLALLVGLPCLREAVHEVHRQQAAEDGVARVGGGRGQDAHVKVRVDGVVRPQQLGQLQPLVVPQAVNYEKHDRVVVCLREDKFRHKLVGEYGAVLPGRLVDAGNPVWIMVLDEGSKFAVGLLELVLKNLPGVFVVRQLQVVLNKRLVKVDPLVGREGAAEALRDLVERL